MQFVGKIFQREMSGGGEEDFVVMVNFGVSFDIRYVHKVKWKRGLAKSLPNHSPSDTLQSFYVIYPTIVANPMQYAEKLPQQMNGKIGHNTVYCPIYAQTTLVLLSIHI